MISESFKYMFHDEHWKKKLAIGGIIAIIPIFNFLLYGYMIDIIKLTPIALSHYANTNKLSSIFEFSAIFGILKKHGLI